MGLEEETIMLEETGIERETKGKKVETAMKQAGLFFFLLMILELPYALLVNYVQMQFQLEYDTLISVLMTQGYLLIMAIVYIIVTKKSFTRDLHVRKYKVSTFFLSLVVLMVASPMATWLNVLSQLFAKNSTSGAIYDITRNVPAWLGIMIIGCLPGFVEETLYRGIMYSAFRQRSILTGVVISGLSFGLMHMNFNQILYAVYLGIVFALLTLVLGALIGLGLEKLAAYLPQQLDHALTRVYTVGIHPLALCVSICGIIGLVLGYLIIAKFVRK